MLYSFYKNFLDEKERVVLFIGGGGKSTLIDRIIQDCKKYKKNIIVLSLFPFTTPIEADVIIIEDLSLMKNSIKYEFALKKILYLGKRYKKGYIEGFSKKEIKKIIRDINADHFLINADFTSRRSISSYKNISSFYPFTIDRVINIIGADAINQKVSNNWIFTKDLFWRDKTILSPVNIEKWIKKHPVLNKFKEKSIPETYFINKVENIYVENLSILLAKNLKLIGINKVIIGSVFNSTIQLITNS
jgi:hypothetical protein